ncbi:MAG TPA: amidohydrolase family protein [Pyrinomonadaceae bacterium]|nr:amidohydrolase family protein [Pyrinomonadaceae bacterium]
MTKANRPQTNERRRARAAHFVAALALVVVLSPSTLAQNIGDVSVQTMSGPQGTYVIRGARVVTVSGAELSNASVVVRNGRIESVGENVNAPAGAQEIDGRGLFVYPGMIDAATNMGLMEISSVAATVDRAEVGEMNPNARALTAVNPHSAHVAVTRVAGITSVVTMPQGGVISGQAAVINLNGTTPGEMSVAPSAALVIDFPRVAAGGGFFAQQAQAANINEASATRDRQVENLRRMLRDAEAYGRAHDAYTRDPRSVPRPDTDIILAALVPFVRGERPVVFRAERERDIRAAVRFADEMKLKPVILGGNDAWKAADILKQRDVPVILTGLYTLPMREDDPYDTLYENAAQLHRAGVRFCISTGDPGPEVRDLPFQAGMAAAFGLPRDAAIKAVTLYPAQIFGVAGQMGSIEPGKLANLVVTDGDLLEARTNIRHLFIEGRLIPLVSRHTILYDQFKDRK